MRYKTPIKNPINVYYNVYFCLYAPQKYPEKSLKNLHIAQEILFIYAFEKKVI